MHTSSRTVFGDDPELAVDRKSIVDAVYVLCFTLLELLEYLDLVDEVFDVLIFLASVGFVVGGIDVDDFERYDLASFLVATVQITC